MIEKFKMIKTLKINANEFIYLILWFIYVVAYVFDKSLINIRLEYKAYELFASCVLIFYFALHNKTKLKKILFVSLTLVLLFLAAIRINKLQYMLLFLFLIDSDLCKIDDILKVSIVGILSSVMIVVFLSQVGVIQDYIFMRDDFKQAHCLGFSYYYTVSTMFLFAVIMYLYIRINIRYIELAAILFVGFTIYKFCTTRLPFYILIIAIAIYLLMCKYNLIRSIDNKFCKIVSLFLGPLFFVVSVAASILYNENNRYLVFLDKCLNGRLHLSNLAFKMYDVKFLGQSIEMVGNEYGKKGGEYFFIDSGYILSILNYGIVFTLILLLLYSLIGYNACRRNDKKLFIWVIIVLLFNVVNGCWIISIYNPILFILLGNRYNQVKGNLNEKININNHTGLQLRKLLKKMYR